MYDGGAAELQSAIMILNLVIQGAVFALKIPASLGAKGLKVMGMAIYHAITKDNKEIGETNVKQLVARGGDIKILQFDEKDWKLFRKLAKEYGILYTHLPDLNLKDGKTEVMFHTEAVERMNALMGRLESGKMISQEEYVNNAQEEEIERVEGEIVEDFKKDNPEFDMDFREKYRKRVRIEEKMVYIPELEKEEWLQIKKLQSYQNNSNMQVFRVSMKDIYDETDKFYMAKVPYSQESAYIKISKDCAWSINGELHTFFEKGKMVDLYNMSGKEIRGKSCEALYHDHYNPVTVSILRKNLYANDVRTSKDASRQEHKKTVQGYNTYKKMRENHEQDSYNYRRQIGTTKTQNQAGTYEPAQVKKDYKPENSRTSNNGSNVYQRSQTPKPVQRKTIQPKIEFSMNHSLAVLNSKDAVVFRVPYTDGKLLVSIPKEDLTLSGDKKTYFVKYDQNKSMTVLGRNGNNKENMTAKSLFEKYYAKIQPYPKEKKGMPAAGKIPEAAMPKAKGAVR